MTDESRHMIMAVIKGKDTTPEILVRHEQWKRGFRYRMNEMSDFVVAANCLTIRKMR